MKIYQSDYEQILTELLHQRWSGWEYVAFDTQNGPVIKEGLFHFDTPSEAKEFCAEKSNSIERYDWLAIRSVYRCMSEALHDKSLLVEKGGVVDISAMLGQYYKRMVLRGELESDHLKIILVTEEERLGVRFKWHEIINYLEKKYIAGDRFVSFPINKSSQVDNLVTHKDIIGKLSLNPDYASVSIKDLFMAIQIGVRKNDLVLHADRSTDLLEVLIKNGNGLIEQNLEQLKQKEEVMNVDVFDYLRKQMLYAGLGDVPVNELQKKLEEGKQEFQINHKRKFGSVEVTARLNFKQSDKNIENYFFNSFDVLFKKEGEKETMQQNFRIVYGESFRFDEAYKLMNGRSINKTFVMTDKLDKNIRQELNATAYMDFKNVDKYGNFEIVKVYGYDLEKKLAEYPIKDFENESVKNKIVTDLKNGDIASVIMKTAKGDLEMRLSANAQFDKLNLFDAKMKPLSKAVIKEIENKESVRQSTAKSQSKKQGSPKSQSRKQGAAKSQSKVPGENTPGAGTSKVIMKPEQGPDKNPSLRVG